MYIIYVKKHFENLVEINVDGTPTKVDHCSFCNFTEKDLLLDEQDEDDQLQE